RGCPARRAHGRGTYGPVPRTRPRNARRARRAGVAGRPARAPAAVARSVSLLEPLRRVETSWWFGRRVAPQVTMLLAPAASYGVERVPREGGAVVAANHFSGIDHPLIGSFSPRPLHFLAKSELFDIAGLGALLGWLGVVSVRRGEGDREALRRSR